MNSPDKQSGIVKVTKPSDLYLIINDRSDWLIPMMEACLASGLVDKYVFWVAHERAYTVESFFRQLAAEVEDVQLKRLFVELSRRGDLPEHIPYNLVDILSQFKEPSL